MTGPDHPQTERLPAPASEPRWASAPSRISLWGMLARHRFLVAACTITVVATSALVTSRITPRYEASASIRIEPEDAGPFALTPSKAPSPNELTTEFQVLQSRWLLGAVVDSLGLQVELRPSRVPRADVFRAILGARAARPAVYRLDRRADGRVAVRDATNGEPIADAGPGGRLDLRGLQVWLASPERLERALAAGDGHLQIEAYAFDQAVDRLQKHLRVRRRPDANILDVSYDGTDPRLVQAVPNVLAARFISARQSDRRAEARSTAQFLREQIDKLSDRLRTAEEDLRAFRERRGVVSLPDEASTGVVRAGELQAQRNSLEAERTALAKLVAAVQDSVRANPVSGMLAYRTLAAFPTLLKNDAMSQLLASLATVEDRRSELLTRRTAPDPDVQALTGRANQIGQQLGAMAVTYLQGLTNQVVALDSVLAQSREQLARIPAKELEFTRRQREQQGLETVVTQLQSRLKEAEIAEAVEDPSVRLVDAAELPRTPSSPNVPLNLALALVFGLGLGAAGAFLREYADHTARSREDVRLAMGVPVIGLLPHAPRRLAARRVAPLPAPPRRAQATTPGGPGILRPTYSMYPGQQGAEPPREPVNARSAAPNLGLPSSPASAPARRPPRGTPSLLIGPGTELFPSREGYNQLATNLAFAGQSGPPQVLMVTSPLPGEGKTTVAVNLAVTLAQSGSRVLLIDADLRRGAVAAALGARTAPGLAEVLLDALPAVEAVQRAQVIEGDWLHLISRGRTVHSPPALLGGPFASALRSLRAEYDIVILDTPPVNVVADAKMIAAHCDGVLVVARAGMTNLDALAFANEELRHIGAPLLGTVLNSIDFRRDANYDQAYRYYASSAAYARESG